MQPFERLFRDAGQRIGTQIQNLWEQGAERESARAGSRIGETDDGKTLRTGKRLCRQTVSVKNKDKEHGVAKEEVGNDDSPSILFGCGKLRPECLPDRCD